MNQRRNVEIVNQLIIQDTQIILILIRLIYNNNFLQPDISASEERATGYPGLATRELFEMPDGIGLPEETTAER